MRTAMNNEKELLKSLLEENKISKKDYSLLLAAFAKKVPLADETLSLIANPFQKIAGFPALIFGIAIIFFMSYLGTIAKVYFPGVIDCSNTALWPKINFSFLVLIYQNLISWLVITAVFIAVTKILRQKRTRIIDFFGTTAFARYPYLLLVGIISIIRLFDPNNGNLIAIATGKASIHPIMESVFSMIALLFALWQIVTYFFAFKESSGLIGKKLWLGFFVAMVSAEAISSLLTMALL
jgi:hypothetical protein